MITGTGDVFIPGGDLGEGSDDEWSNIGGPALHGHRPRSRRCARPRKPVVSAVNGHLPGRRAHDRHAERRRRWPATRPTFRAPELLRGISDTNYAQILPRQIGPSRARDMLLTGAPGERRRGARVGPGVAGRAPRRAARRGDRSTRDVLPHRPRTPGRTSSAASTSTTASTTASGCWPVSAGRRRPRASSRSGAPQPVVGPSRPAHGRPPLMLIELGAVALDSRLLRRRDPLVGHRMGRGATSRRRGATRRRVGGRRSATCGLAEEYDAWYPTFAEQRVSPWPRGRWSTSASISRPRRPRVAKSVLAPFNLGRLNPLGLELARRRRCSRTAPRSSGSGSSRRWCATRRSGASCSPSRAPAPTSRRWPPAPCATATSGCSTARRCGPRGPTSATSPSAWRAPTRRCKKRQGLTYFIVDLHAPGVDVRPLRHLGGEVDFNEVFLDDVRIPDSHRIGAAGDGWRVAGSSLAGERQMVSGAGSGGVDRIGGAGVAQLLAAGRAAAAGPTIRSIRQRLMAVYAEEQVREWTNQRVRAAVQAGGTPGAAASIGKVHQGALNQRIQMLAADLLGSRPRRRGTAEPEYRRQHAARGARACCAPAPTRSKAARPRSTRTSSANGSWACHASPTRGPTSRGRRSHDHDHPPR